MHFLRLYRADHASLSQIRIAIGFIFALLPAVPCLPATVSPSVPVSSTTTAKFSPTSFPVIYVASAVVDCGAPLVRDICSTSVFNSLFPVSAAAATQQLVTTRTSRVTTETVTSIVTVYQMLPSSSCMTGNQTIVSTVSYTLVSTMDVSQVSTIFLPSSHNSLSAFSTSTSLSITRLSEERSYKPSLIHTSGPPLPQVIFKRDIPSTPASPKLAPRSYDYNPCYDVPPNHDMVTNSLTDVCHFVANAQNYFVSLVPISSAAYLPSWVGYLWQTVQALIELWSIVKFVGNELTLTS